ncbi:pyrroline-5-carboxylate reductase [Anopheles merus]|uniref:Pyrroline-5-carboxylate reductase n=1 Tax=Anopheles merus TaxID=30066 RepID=A0A182US20_ANOME|nr:pyrroline-5-carboxylate reductase [Anopheles merus]
MSSPAALQKCKAVGFIGGGNMAYAIASGLLSKGVLQPDQIIVSATRLENLQARWAPLGVTRTTVDNAEVILQSDIVFICVKPQMFNYVLANLNIAKLKQYDKSNQKLYVSIMAGVTLSRLIQDLEMFQPCLIARAMPNTPVQVGVGCTVYCRVVSGHPVPPLYRDMHTMFAALGVVHEVEESKMNAATGLAGCGPAYVYEFIEALADGGVKQGIPRDMALQLAAQTVMGAAKTVLDTGKHPAVLKDEVCSPGGATIHGVHALEQGSMRGTVMNAVESATKRAAELS